MSRDPKFERKKKRAQVSRKIRLLKREGKPQKQAVAIALDISRPKGKAKRKAKSKRSK